MNLLRKLKSLLRVVTRSVQMSISGLAIAFFIVLRSSPVSQGGKVVVFSGLSVQALKAITLLVHGVPPGEKVFAPPNLL